MSNKKDPNWSIDDELQKEGFSAAQILQLESPERGAGLQINWEKAYEAVAKAAKGLLSKLSAAEMSRDVMKKVFEGCLESMAAMDKKHQATIEQLKKRRTVRVGPKAGRRWNEAKHYELEIGDEVRHLIVSRLPRGCELQNGDGEEFQAEVLKKFGPTAIALLVHDGAEVTVLELDPVKKVPAW